MISSGKIIKAQRVVIYGPEGIGKTTLASQFPNPVFIDTEGSTEHLDVKRMQTKSWEDLLANLESVKSNKDKLSTLIIDTIDWAEKQLIRKLCTEHNKKGIEDFGYGKGYVYLSEAFSRLLDILDGLRESGINIVLVAHSAIKRFDLPEDTGSYDRYELKLEKKTTPLVKEWADMILFCNYKTFLVEIDGKKKAQGGSHVMYTRHTTTHDAKNRHGLAEELEMDFKSIAHCIPAQKIDATAFLTELYDLMERDGVTADEVKNLVVSSKAYATEVAIDSYDETYVKEKIIKHWDKFLAAVIKRRGA